MSLRITKANTPSMMKAGASRSCFYNASAAIRRFFAAVVEILFGIW
jgi:hypothetical protein